MCTSSVVNNSSCLKPIKRSILLCDYAFMIRVFQYCIGMILERERERERERDCLIQPGFAVPASNVCSTLQFQLVMCSALLLHVRCILLSLGCCSPSSGAICHLTWGCLSHRLTGWRRRWGKPISQCPPCMETCHRKSEKPSWKCFVLETGGQSSCCYTLESSAW